MKKIMFVFVFLLFLPFVFSNDVVVLLNFSDLNQFSYNISHDGSSYTKVGARTGFNHLLPNDLYMNGYFTSNHPATNLFNSSGFGDANYPDQNFLVFNSGDDGGQDLNFAFFELDETIYIQNFTIDVESFNNGQAAHLVCFANDINITFCAGLYTQSCIYFVNVPDEFNQLQNKLEIGCEEMANHADTAAPFTFKRSERDMDTFISVSSGRLTENSFNDVEVTRIGIISANSASTGSGIYSLINISFVNGTNSVPTFNLIYNDTLLCIDSNDDNVQNTQSALFNYTVNATDIEGDTLYYSDTVVNFARKDLFYQEDFVIQGQEECTDDWNFLKSENLISNYTKLESSWDWSFWFANPLRVYDVQTLLMKFNDAGGCEGNLLTYEEVERFIITPTQLYQDDIEIWVKLTTPYNNTYFSSIYTDSEFANVVNITFNQTTEGNLSIEIDGTERFNAVHDNSEEIYSYVQLNKSDNSVTVNIAWDSEIDGLDYSFNKTFNNWYAIVFDTKDLTKRTTQAFWSLKRITTEGSNFEPQFDWSTTPLTQSTIPSWGGHYIDIYVTDEVNLGLGRYNTESIYVNVLQCDDLIDFDKTVAGVKPKGALASLRTSFSDLCNVNIFGFKLCWAFILIYWAACIMIGLTMGLAFFRDINTSYFIALTMIIFGAWFLPYSLATSIVFAFLWSVSLAYMIYAGSMGTSSSSGDLDE